MLLAWDSGNADADADADAHAEPRPWSSAVLPLQFLLFMFILLTDLQRIVRHYERRTRCSRVLEAVLERCTSGFQPSLEKVGYAKDIIEDVLYFKNKITELCTTIRTRREELQSGWQHVCSSPVQLPVISISTYIEGLVSSVSHFVRSIRKDDLTTSQRSTISLIRRRHIPLTRVARLLLEMAQIERGKFVVQQDSIDMSAVCLQAYQRWNVCATARGLKLVLDDQTHGDFARGDRRHVLRVLDTMVCNAVQNTEAGSVQITLRCQGRPPRSDCQFPASGSWRSATGMAVVVSITDTGCGMPPCQVKDLFRPPQEKTVLQASSGLGIDLCVARSIVTLLNGYPTALPPPRCRTLPSMPSPLFAHA